MAKVLVLGASGVLGAHVSRQAMAAGHEVRRATSGHREGWHHVDLATGDGLGQALDGVDAVVHCGAAPFTRRQDVVEAGAMQRIRDAAPDVRILYPSIVGVDRIPHFSYYRTKVLAEQALAAAGGDHAIVRFTQFHEFADRFAAMRIVVFPRHFRFQSLAGQEAAAELVRLVDTDDHGLIGDFGGPEVHELRDMVRDRLRADGRRRPVIAMPMGRFSKALKAGLNLCPDAAKGKITWDEHLRATSGGGRDDGPSARA